MTALDATPTIWPTTVLLVDDQPAIVRALELGLKRHKFRVLTAGNGRDALGILEAEPELDVLVSDIVMPGGMSGFELARLALTLRPGLPLLLTTGYSYDQVEAHNGQADKYKVLTKPFSLVELVSQINDLLPVRSRPDTTA